KEETKRGEKKDQHQSVPLPESEKDSNGAAKEHHQTRGYGTIPFSILICFAHKRSGCGRTEVIAEFCRPFSRNIHRIIVQSVFFVFLVEMEKKGRQKQSRDKSCQQQIEKKATGSPRADQDESAANYQSQGNCKIKRIVIIAVRSQGKK